MKIKRYIGKNTQEAMLKLKREMGSNAVILHTRKIKQHGFTGLFKKSLIEVVAAKEENAIDYNTCNKKVIQANTTVPNNIIYNKNQTFSECKDTYDLKNNINILQSTMDKMMKSIDENNFCMLPENLNFYRKLLIKNGIDNFVATKIIERINKQIDVSIKENEIVRRIVKHNIKEYLGKPQPIEIENGQKVIFFVGSTGVGKTTTLAKIAAKFTLNGNYKIGLITADTYRIAAVEQLRIYSEIMKLPLEIIYNSEEINNVMSKFKDKDIILIDTAGRSHKNTQQIDELKRLLSKIPNKETYLVLSATTDIESTKAILNQYKFIKDYKLIFTKTDECQNLGIVLNTKFYTDNPLSYFTMGQNVPEDIEIANVDSLCDNLIRETDNEGSS